MENTKYWIIVASKEHVETGVKGGFAQACHGKATPLKKMKKGDFVIYYSSKEYFDKKDKCQKFTAIGQVKSDDIYQFEMTPTFCPFRMDIEFFEAKNTSILPLIKELDFIPNKEKWGYPFRYGILQINQHDYDLISKLMLDDEEIDFHFESPEENLGYLLWQTTMIWQKKMNRALDEINLTHTQFVIMAALGWLLKTEKNITQKEIAAHSNTDRMMVSKVLRTLQTKELIERKEHETDTRAKCVFLTKKGIQTLQKAIEIKTEANHSFFGKLSNKEVFRNELRSILE